VVASLNATMAFVEGAEWVQRCAYFGDFRVGDGNGYVGQGGAVWDGNGDITEVGEVWLGLNSTPGTSGGTVVGRASYLALFLGFLVEIVLF
jgi:Glycosyl hydrolase catalytic core